MKLAILLAIRVYWLIIPVKFRRSCLFKESCSHFVFRTTKEKGFFCGIQSFMQRKKQCRSGYQIIFSDSTRIKIKLVDGSLVSTNELSDKMLKEVNELKNII